MENVWNRVYRIFSKVPYAHFLCRRNAPIQTYPALTIPSRTNRCSRRRQHEHLCELKTEHLARMNTVISNVLLLCSQIMWIKLNENGRLIKKIANVYMDKNERMQFEWYYSTVHTNRNSRLLWQDGGITGFSHYSDKWESEHCNLHFNLLIIHRRRC
jgi:hypothetical protein